MMNMPSNEQTIFLLVAVNAVFLNSVIDRTL